MDDASEMQCVEEALNKHQSSLIRFALSFLRDLESARDAVQDAYFEMIRRRCCCSLDNPKAWLFKVCRHKAYRLLKKEKHLDRDGDPETLADDREIFPDGSYRLLAEERSLAITEAVGRLPPRQRQVIQLHYLEQLSLGEVAQVLGDKPNNIYQLHHAGLVSLRRILAREAEGKQAGACSILNQSAKKAD